MIKSSKQVKGRVVVIDRAPREDEEDLIDTGESLPIGEPFSHAAVSDEALPIGEPYYHPDEEDLEIFEEEEPR